VSELERLRTFNENHATLADLNAIRWAVAEIERLTGELASAQAAAAAMRKAAEGYVPRADLDAANRELERWRHGATIEGDYVCSHQLEATNLRAECDRRVSEALNRYKAQHDDGCRQPTIAGCSCGLGRLLFPDDARRQQSPETEKGEHGRDGQ
jgi:hypothetical protein